MGVKNWPVWRAGIFKNAKLMVSSPSRSQTALLISETRVLSLEVLPMDIGYAYSNARKMGWDVIHALTTTIKGVEGSVLPISERSRYPLDPYTVYTKEELDKAASLDVIHGLTYTKNFALLGQGEVQSPVLKMVNTVVYVCGFIAALAIVLAFFAGRGG